MIDEIEKLITSHMKKQPWKCVCEDCGENVELIIDIDYDMDMSVTVPVCDCASNGDAGE